MVWYPSSPPIPLASNETRTGISRINDDGQARLLHGQLGLFSGTVAFWPNPGILSPVFFLSRIQRGHFPSSGTSRRVEQPVGRRLSTNRHVYIRNDGASFSRPTPGQETRLDLNEYNHPIRGRLLPLAYPASDRLAVGSGHRVIRAEA